MSQVYFMSLLADAYGRADRPGEGLATIEEALVLCDKTHERFCEAELHRLRGELQLRARPPRTAEAEVSFARALEVARTQQALGWELRAATSLARLWGRGRPPRRGARAGRVCLRPLRGGLRHARPRERAQPARGARVRTLRMAWRNLWRNPRRTAVTVTAMTVGLLAMILYSSMMEGYLQGMERSVLDLEMGDLQVFAGDYRQRPDLYTRIETPEELLAPLEQAGYPATARLLAYGMAATDETSAASPSGASTSSRTGA